VLETLRSHGLGALGRVKVRVGNPVRPMLAERLKTADDVYAKLGTCFVEEKLDGLRFQVHVSARGVEVFSRNLERTTGAFPDIARAVRTHFGARTAIIDGEALAVNDETGEYHPFQVTVQRKRKNKIEAMAEEFPLVLVAFDLIYADGKDLTSRPFEERRAELEARIGAGGRIVLSRGVLARDATAVNDFFDEAAERGLEGVIAKRPDAPYTPGGRNYNWVKLKRNYRGELSDTIDVALVGYLRGRGARARLGIGSLLGAAYNREADTFETVAKIGSGLSEADWVRLRGLLDADERGDRPARVDARLEADVWVEPRHVVTVLADEITRSPVHTAARDAAGRGLALRFPRVVGPAPRDDKSPEDATTSAEVAEMFAMQRQRKST
jgi:DNA ligase 1